MLCYCDSLASKTTALWLSFMNWKPESFLNNLVIICQASVCRYIILSLQVQLLTQRRAAVNKKLKSMEDMKKQSLERKWSKKPRREPFRKRVTYWHNRKVTEGEALRAKGNDRGGWEKKRGYKINLWGFICKYSGK